MLQMHFECSTLHAVSSFLELFDDKPFRCPFLVPPSLVLSSLDISSLVLPFFALPSLVLPTFVLLQRTKYGWKEGMT